MKNLKEQDAEQIIWSDVYRHDHLQYTGSSTPTHVHRLVPDMYLIHQVGLNTWAKAVVSSCWPTCKFTHNYLSLSLRKPLQCGAHIWSSNYVFFCTVDCLLFHPPFHRVSVYFHRTSLLLRSYTACCVGLMICITKTCVWSVQTGIWTTNFRSHSRCGLIPKKMCKPSYYSFARFRPALQIRFHDCTLTR